MSIVVVAVANGARRSALSLVLHGAGHAVEAVGDAEALLEVVERRGPDVLLLDPGLPRLDAVEPLRRLRDSGRLRGVRLVLVDDPCAPARGWASLAKQFAAGVLADIARESILRSVDGTCAPRPAAGHEEREPAEGPAGRTPADPAGRRRAFDPLPGRPSGNGALRAGAGRTGGPAAPPPAAAPPFLPAPAAPAGVPDRPRILVVEDSPTVRALTGIHLEEAGWEVAWAGSSEEAQAALSAEIFQAVLADINLPGMSGDQFVLVARKGRPGLRCMLMTARPRSRWPRMPDDIPVFAKPLDMDLLLRELGSVRLLIEG
ncbi:MAG: response regulator [Planctomycetes bacterium]|nr:response regulator [Planctomycetota bacterium]